MFYFIFGVTGIVLFLLILISLTIKIKKLSKLALFEVKELLWPTRDPSNDIRVITWSESKSKVIKLLQRKECSFFNLVIYFIICTLPFASFYFEMLPSNIQLLYPFLVLFSLVSFFIITSDIIIRKSKGFERFNISILIIFFILALSFSLVGLNFELFMDGNLAFFDIFISIIVIIIPLMSFVKTLLDNLNFTWFSLFLSIFVFLFAELYMIILFGLYNLSENLSIMKAIFSKSAADIFSGVILYGAQYMFSLPTPSVELGWEPVAQFFIGLIFNVAIVGFFVSYISSIIGEKRFRRF